MIPSWRRLPSGLLRCGTAGSIHSVEISTEPTLITFILKMAWREMRAAWRHFAYFFVCIALGVGALVGVDTLATNVDHTVTREARALMGGDVEIRLSRPISENGESVVRALSARCIQTTHVSELVAMA